MDRQKYLWNPLMGYWFRMEIDGWEHLPEAPVLLIGIHSGTTR
jgi:1-acyl-sn-glycerol-3-phosphate acyltransferase